MSVEAASVTTGAAAVLIESGTSDGKTVCLRDASQDTYLGGSGVTTAQGFKMVSTDVFTFVLYAGDDLYAIAAGAGTIRKMAFRDNT